MIIGTLLTGANITTVSSTNPDDIPHSCADFEPDDRLGAIFEYEGLYYQVIIIDFLCETTTRLVAPPEDKKADYLKGVTKVTIPQTVVDPATGKEYSVVEAAGAFADLPDLEEVTLTDILYVRDFFNLPKLHTVNLYPAVRTIGGFWHLPNLKSIQIPELTQLIASQSFRHVGLESLYLPVTINAIDNYSMILDNVRSAWFPGLTAVGRNSLHFSLDKFVFPPWFQYTDYNSVVGRIDEIWFLDDGIERETYFDLHSLICETKRIYCERTVPPVILASEYFDSDDPDGVIFLGPEKVKDITLYVPRDCVEAYRQAPIWNRMKIVAHNFDSDIESIEKDDLRESRGTLYDLSGRVVTTLSPRPGIYVRDGKKILIR